MTEVYNSANNVVIWLGDSDSESDEAISFINDITAAGKQGSEATKRYLCTVINYSHGFTLWRSLLSFRSRPYFSRLWIIQEIAMGDEDSLILCGAKVTTWGAMYNVYHSLRISDTKTNDLELTLIFRAELELHSAAYKAYRDVRFYIWKKVEDYRTLQDYQRGGFYRHGRQLVTRCRMASCFEPRD